MCYSDEARVPTPPIDGEVLSHGEIHLDADDGNRAMAYFASPAQPNGTGVILLPDRRGMHRFYKDLCLSFAKTGSHTVSFDYFGRTAGDGPRDESFEFMPHFEAVRESPRLVDADARAAFNYLRQSAGDEAESIFAVGFCFGGSAAWRQSAVLPGVAGCAGLYGIPARVEHFIPEMKAPLLVIVAGADFTPKEDWDAFDQNLTAGGVPHRMVTYDDAPHGFWDEAMDEHREACADSWHQILDFIGEHTVAHAGS